MQKKRWPFFFFFDGRPLSSSTLSASDPSSPSSERAMSMSCDNLLDLAERCESPLPASSFLSSRCESCDSGKVELKGDIGRARLPLAAAKLFRVGVVASVSSRAGTGGGRETSSMGARGVVGVVASPFNSFGPSVTLTDWKVVIVDGGSRSLDGRACALTVDPC